MTLSEYSKEYQNDKNNLQKKEAYFKACYEIFLEYDCVKSLELIKRSVEEGSSPEIISKKAIDYMAEFQQLTKEEISNFIETKRQIHKENQRKNLLETSDYKRLYLKLINIDPKNTDQIIQLIDNSGLNVIYLKSQVYDFVRIYFPNRKYLVNDLTKKIQLYLDYKSQNKKQTKKDKKRREYLEIKIHIEKYIYEDYGIKEDYCKDNDLTIATFDNYVNLVKKFDDALYQKYLEQNRKKMTERYIELISKIKELICYINNGVKYQDDKVRPFDIIDYYQFIGMNFKDLSRICQNCNFIGKEFQILKKFMVKNNVTNDYNVMPKILNSVLEVNCQKDSNGNLIPGTGRIIDIGKKERIVNFLKKYNVPINEKNYYIAFRRYKNETLFEEPIKDNLNLKTKKKANQ